MPLSTCEKLTDILGQAGRIVLNKGAIVRVCAATSVITMKVAIYRGSYALDNWVIPFVSAGVELDTLIRMVDNIRNLDTIWKGDNWRGIGAAKAQKAHQD